MSVLEEFQPKLVQGLYTLSHYERADGAWYQVPHGRGGQIVYCAHEGAPFVKFDTLTGLVEFLQKEQVA